MRVSFDGFKSIIGKNSIDDFVCFEKTLLVEIAFCTKPDQFGRG